MKIKLIIALVAGVITLNLNSAKAQTAATAAPSAATLKAAEEMLLASSGGDQFNKTINAVLAQSAGSIPEDKRPKFIEVMKTFMTKYCSWDVMKGDLIMMYAREFTETELKELTAFYKTPIGKKLNEKLPVITAASSALGQKAVAAHAEELQQMMMDAMK